MYLVGGYYGQCLRSREEEEDLSGQKECVNTVS